MEVKTMPMKHFKCEQCGNTYLAQGNKQSYVNPVYGPCERYVSSCPACGGEGYEFQKNPGNKKQASSCGCGSCGCGH